MKCRLEFTFDQQDQRSLKTTAHAFDMKILLPEARDHITLQVGHNAN